MEYVKPNMDIIKFDKKSITTTLYASPESEESGGSGTTVPDDMWD